MELDEVEVFRARVRDAIQNGGGVSIVSQKTGIPIGTLNKYVAQTSTASFTNAAKIAVAVGISLEEMAFGRSASSVAATTNHSQPINPSLMQRLGQFVDMAFREEGGRIRDLELVIETGKAYNDLCALVDDLTDADAVEEALPLVKRRLKKRLADTANNPANRKHSA
ncbi:hypothetical protein [Brucella sp. 10RB9215]|uniref:hypothetical protein n=1 Tax=Brucella sp. 10RB9215 TaxID=1149953 RepID=UPI0010FD1877|nr:hypothetical protein [Brucella sp. 10RB9215]